MSVKFKEKYCEECEEYTTHEYVGKEMYWILPLWFKKYWKCEKCGAIHEQDTAYPEDKKYN